MPLPAALLARLSKRGIVNGENEENQDNGDEHIEAEDGLAEEKQHRRKHGKSRRKPAPPGWFRVPDTGSGHSYYWNVNTNQVSWCHPEDPEAVITMPASWKPAESKPDVTPEVQATPALDDKAENDKSGAKPKFSKNVSIGKHPSLMKAKRDRERTVPYKSKRDRRSTEEADPMDPSSYSDVAKGSWSSGLVAEGDAKTGVDTTANGPLFQQRPYPSPGDILRRNQAAKKSS